MAVADRYSRLVLWLKVALPLVALAILSTLFFVAETLDPEAAIPYAEVDVERILREQGVTRPTFGGVSGDGAAISLTAESVRPDAESSSRLNGAELSATIDLPDGGRVNIVSPNGMVDADTSEASLEGGARLESSTGYVVATERIESSYAEVRVFAEGDITATGPGGDLTAGQMELTQDVKTGRYVLVFNKGVRLLYEPQR